MMNASKGRDESASCKGLTKQPNVGELKTFGSVGFGICMIICKHMVRNVRQLERLAGRRAKEKGEVAPRVSRYIRATVIHCIGGKKNDACLRPAN